MIDATETRRCVRCGLAGWLHYVDVDVSRSCSDFLPENSLEREARLAHEAEEEAEWLAS